MEHNRAVESQAIERYLLGEMEPDERELFEEHFFTCEECAEGVRAGARLRANARKVLPEFQRQGPERQEIRFWTWLRPPALAWFTAALAAVVFYQSAIQLPALRAQLHAQAVPALALRPATRGDDALPKVPASAGLFTVYFDLPNPSAVTYQCTLTDAQGKVVDRFEASFKPNEAINVLLDRRRLAPGRHTLTLKPDSDPGALPNQYRFVVE